MHVILQCRCTSHGRVFLSVYRQVQTLIHNIWTKNHCYIIHMLQLANELLFLNKFVMHASTNIYPPPPPPAQLSREEKERWLVEHGITSLQKDMTRLNTLITEKRGEQEKLEQGTILMENDFVHALKVWWPVFIPWSTTTMLHTCTCTCMCISFSDLHCIGLY